MGANTNIIFLRRKDGTVQYRAQVTRRRGHFRRSIVITFPTLKEAIAFRDEVTAGIEKDLVREEETDRMTFDRMLSMVKRTLNVYTDKKGTYFTIVEKSKSRITGNMVYQYGLLYARDKDISEEDVLDFMSYNEPCECYAEEMLDRYYFEHGQKVYVAASSDSDLDALDEQYLIKSSHWSRARHEGGDN